jgi:hypothetical protein
MRQLQVLLGACSTWFLLDVAYYSQNLLQADMYDDINYSHKVDIKESSGHDIFLKVPPIPTVLLLCLCVVCGPLLCQGCLHLVCSEGVQTVYIHL